MSIKDVDVHKLSYHPKRVMEWLRTGKCFPLHVEIGPTNRCNHRCVFCTLDWITHGKDDIDKNIMISALKEMSEARVKSIYFAGEGEPTLHKDIDNFIISSKEFGLKVALSTNGSKKISKESLKCLSWIRISLDAGTSETYSKIHRVSKNEFNKVLKNIEYLVENKVKDIGVQAVLMPENISEMEPLAKLLKSVGVDNFQVKPCHNHPKSSHTPAIYEFSQQELKDKLECFEDSKFSVIVRVKSMERLHQEKKYKECHGLHFYSLIDAKGNVLPCNIFYDNKNFIYGNLYKDSFKEIWTSARHERIINNISKLNFKNCGNYRCRFDVMNRFLERVKNPEVNDEFI